MIDISADPARQRLNLTVASPYTEQEMAGVPGKVKAAASGLRPGFTAAVDLSAAGVLAQDQTDRTRAVQELFKALGAGRVVTLMAGTAQQLQLNRLGNEAGTTSFTQRFSDRAAWQKALDS